MLPPILDTVYFSYGLAASLGRRPYMEDRHLVVGEIGDFPSISLYGVFDGHNGSSCADFCVEKLVPLLKAQETFPTKPDIALIRAFEACDNEFISAAIEAKPPLDSGTTAVIALVLWGRQLVIANAGDSRAVLVYKNGRTEALSDDHKPNRPDEALRIKNLGGTIAFHGVWRVSGVLAVSRSLGDKSMKPYVTATPDIRSWTLGPSDRYLVLATDGVFDVLSNREIGTIANSTHGGAQELAEALVHTALARDSTDNITALVIDLTKPNPKLAISKGHLKKM